VELLPSTAKLTVSDCGYGMTEEFIRHNLYVPFAQQDPIANGIGLGLSLIKRNLDSLGGTIQIETDRALGTTAKVSVEIERLANGVIQKSGAGNGRLNGTATIPSLLKQPKDKLPVLKACFYAPSTWIRRYDKRDERSIDLVYRSLSRTLSEWFQPVLSIWQQQENREPPDLVFISQRNLATFMEECGEKFANVKKVVICAATSKDSVKDREMAEEAAAVADALIIGAVLPSKLWKVVTVFFPRILPPCTPGATQDDTSQAQKPISGDLDTPHSNHQKQPHDAGERNIILSSSASVTTTSPDRGAQPLKGSYNGQNQVPEACKEVDEISPHAEYRPKAEAHMNATPNRAILSSGHTTFEALPAAKHGSADILRKSRTVPLPQSSAQPRLLLVDDNSVNLKMLGMFVNKCGIPGTTSTSVRGGKEAITAFEEGNAGGSDVAPGFDIIFMDLSMPEVSGFDATASIRRIEAASNNDRRAFIVALTGLVSDKDRNAAFEAGVDDYVTKPAGLESVRKIIQAWVAKQKSSP
jgi:CheY-like chemotaxis protein